MKIRKFMLLVVLIPSIVFCSTGCGFDSIGSKGSKQKEVKADRTFQVQRITGANLVKAKEIPYEMKIHTKSKGAFKNAEPMTIGQNAKKVVMNFSFISDESEVIVSVKPGLIIETGGTVEGAKKVNVVGEIATFQLAIEKPETELMTVVYELEMVDSKKKDKKKFSKFIAFRLESPQPPNKENNR